MVQFMVRHTRRSKILDNFKNYNILIIFPFFLNFLGYLVFELDGSAHFEAHPTCLHIEPTFKFYNYFVKVHKIVIKISNISFSK